MVMKAAGADSRLVTAGERERQSAARRLERFFQRRPDSLRPTSPDALSGSAANDPVAIPAGGRLAEAGLCGPSAADRKNSRASLAGNGGQVPALPAGSGSAGAGPRAAAQASPASAAAEAAPRPQPAAAPPAPGADSLKSRLAKALKDSGHDFIADAVLAGEVEQRGGAVAIRPTAEYRAVLELSLGDIEASLEKLLGSKPDVKLGSDAAGDAAPPNGFAPPPPLPKQRPSRTTRSAGGRWRTP